MFNFVQPSKLTGIVNCRGDIDTIMNTAGARVHNLGGISSEGNFAFFALLLFITS